MKKVVRYAIIALFSLGGNKLVAISSPYTNTVIIFRNHTASPLVVAPYANTLPKGAIVVNVPAYSLAFKVSFPLSASALSVYKQDAPGSYTKVWEASSDSPVAGQEFIAFNPVVKKDGALVLSDKIVVKTYKKTIA